MELRRRILICSVSAAALACAGAAPAFAAAATDPGATVDELVVTGIRESLQRAIEVKRDAVNHVDAISATDIGKLPDKNIADALQRLPGINTQSAASGEGGFDENDRVSIRGTSPSLTQVTVDGHTVSTGDWFILDQYQTVGRSISFELLPAEITQAATVYKTQNASLLSGGVAGAIDIQTRSPLSLPKQYTVEASAQVQYNTNTKQGRPQINGLVGLKNADGDLGVILQGFDEKRSVERVGQETLGYTSISSSMPLGAAHPELIGVQAPTLVGSTLFQQQKERYGGFGAVEWKPTNTIDLKLTGFLSKLKAENINDNYMYWGINELNKNTPTSFTVKDNTLVAATWPAGPQGLVVDNIVRPKSNSQTYYVNLDGSWKASDRLSFTGQIGYTQGQGNTPEQPSYEVAGADAGIAIARSGNGWAVNPVTTGSYTGPNSAAGLASGWAWNARFKSQDKEFYAKADGRWDFDDDSAFKYVTFGARVSDHKRQVDAWDRGCTLGANGQCWTSPGQPYSTVTPGPYPSNFTAGNLGIPGLLVPGAGAGSADAIKTAINGINDGVHGPISTVVQPLNYYWTNTFKVSETDVEGYVMGVFGGEKWHGNVGVRLASTQEKPDVNTPDPGLDNPNVITSSAFGPYFVDHIKHTYTDVLPSINLTFDLQENLKLRLSAAGTMSRPDFSALGGTVSLTDLTLTGNGGNPNLKPVRATVYDAALDWYYAPSAVAAVSVFHDDFSSYVSFGNVTGQYRDQQLAGQNGGVAPYRTYTISVPTNVGAELSGVELQVQQPLPYGFGFQANATYVDGHDENGDPLIGTSNWTYNLVGYYEDHGLSARLAYTYRSHFLVGLDRGTIEQEDGNGSLDASVSYQLTPNVMLTFDALNITDSLLKYYAANKTQVRAVYDNGSQFYGGVRVKF